jgi:hypothetical protein
MEKIWILTVKRELFFKKSGSAPPPHPVPRGTLETECTSSKKVRCFLIRNDNEIPCELVFAATRMRDCECCDVD